MRSTQIASACALLGVLLSTAATSQTGPYVHQCLEAYSASAGQARFSATVDWNGIRPGQYARIDLIAEDWTGSYWPQLHDDRLQPGENSSMAEFGVSDVSRYPLTLSLIGMTQAAADTYDADCAQGFCSIKVNAPGVTQLGGGDRIEKPTADTPRCDG